MSDIALATNHAGKVGETPEEKAGKQAAAQRLEDADGEELQSSEASLQRQPLWQPRFIGSDRLAGKVAIITGGDSGIGRATAALFAREGADVAIVYHRHDDDAREVQAAVEAEGRSAVLIRGDVGDPAFCAEAVAQTVETLGGVDILCNIAGEQHPDDAIDKISDEQLRRTFQTNIFSMFYLVQEVLPHLSAGSAIINCTSITAYQGAKGLLDYSSTKGAITAFTRSLSENLAGKGIRVNGVAPGPIWTPLNPLGGADPAKVRTFGESTPMERPGEPNEVAPAFLFLACDDSSYMTGQVLHPNGGTIVNG